MFCSKHSISFENTYLISCWFRCIEKLCIKLRFCETFTVTNFVTRIWLIETISRFRMINPMQDWHFRGCSRWERGEPKRPTPSLKSVTHILQWWNLAVIPYLKKIQKIYDHVTPPLSSADISIFYRKSVNFVISRTTDIDCILIYNF